MIVFYPAPIMARSSSVNPPSTNANSQCNNQYQILLPMNREIA